MKKYKQQLVFLFSFYILAFPSISFCNEKERKQEINKEKKSYISFGYVHRSSMKYPHLSKKNGSKLFFENKESDFSGLSFKLGHNFFSKEGFSTTSEISLDYLFEQKEGAFFALDNQFMGNIVLSQYLNYNITLKKNFSVQPFFGVAIGVSDLSRKAFLLDSDYLSGYNYQFNAGMKIELTQRIFVYGKYSKVFFKIKKCEYSKIDCSNTITRETSSKFIMKKIEIGSGVNF